MAAQLVNGSLDLGRGHADSAAVRLKGRRACLTHLGHRLIDLSCKSISPIRHRSVSCIATASLKLKRRCEYQLPMMPGCEQDEDACGESLYLWHC